MSPHQAAIDMEAAMVFVLGDNRNAKAEPDQTGTTISPCAHPIPE